MPGGSWTVDLLDDRAGLTLVLYGLIRLAPASAMGHWRILMSSLIGLATLALLGSIIKFFSDGSTGAQVLSVLLTWVGVGGMAIFCLLLAGLCRSLGARNLARGWQLVLVTLTIASSSASPAASIVQYLHQVIDDGTLHRIALSLRIAAASAAPLGGIVVSALMLRTASSRAADPMRPTSGEAPLRAAP